MAEFLNSNETGIEGVRIDPVQFMVEDGAILLSKTEESRSAERWKRCLTGYVFGLNLHMPSLRSFILWKWDLIGDLELMARGKSCIILRFLKEADMERVLSLGAWSVSGKLMLLKRWEADDPVELPHMTSFPIWIQILGVPVALWDNAIFAKIGSFLKTLVCTDQVTKKGTRL